MKNFLKFLLVGLLCLAPTLGSDATQRVAALVSPQAINVDLGFVQVGNVGNLSVMGAPSGATFSLLNNPGGHFSIVGTEIVAGSSTPAGQYSLSVQATGPGFSVNKTFVLNFAGVVPPPPPHFFLGLNLSGLEDNTGPPSQTEMAYWVAQGTTQFRLPIAWYGQPDGKSAQPTLFGSLDPTYMATISTVLANAKTLGATILIDLSQFGSGPGGTIGNGTPISAFVDVWVKLSSYFKADPSFSAVLGYDVMNEWHNMDPSAPVDASTPYSQNLIFSANQAVVTGIRNNDDTTTVYLEWDRYSGAWDAVTNNVAMQFGGIIDPANDIVFSFHNYLDQNGSGTFFIWSQVVAAAGESPPGLNVTTNIGPQRMAPVVALAQQYGVRLNIGETGWSNDRPSIGGSYDFVNWNQAGFNLVDYARQNLISVFTWAAGTGFPPSYPLNPVPTSRANFNTKDFTSASVQGSQTVIYQKFNGYAGAQPTSYRSELPIGVNPFTPPTVPLQGLDVYYGGAVPAEVHFTGHANLADGTDVGGTFGSISFPAGDNGVAIFSYTPADAHAGINLTFTNDRGLTDPPAIGISSVSDFFLTNNIASPAQTSNVFALRRMFSTYIGPAVRLQRGDGQQADFYFNVAGDLPRQAIQDWAISRTISVLTVYDQSLNGQHLVYVTGNFAVLNLVNSAGYPEIVFNNSGYAFNTLVGTGSSGNLQQYVAARISDSNTGQFFVSQDTASSSGSLFPFRFNPVFYGVQADSVFASFGVEENVYHSYTGTFIANAANGLVAYKDGSVAQQVSTSGVGGLRSFSTFTTVGYGGFNPGQFWNGAWTNIEIGTVALNSTLVSGLYGLDSTYYSTPLPDALTAVPATVAGAINRKMFNNTSNPFSTVLVTDGNPGATDSVTITLSGSAGTLSGSGLSGSNPYTLSSDTPANITTQLNALTMTSSASTGSVINVAMSVVSSAGGTNSPSFTATQAAYGIETAFAAPPAFTPVSYKGYNIDGAENNPLFTPTAFEYDYAASKGFGIIRININMSDYLTAYTGQTAFNSTILNNLKGSIDYAASKNLRVIISSWNFGTTALLVGGGQFNGTAIVDRTTRDTFCDFWSRMASRFKDYPNVVFDLMNEPNAQTPASWQTTINQCITPIRTAGFNGLVLISGAAVGYFDTADFWTASGNAAVWTTGTVVDPASNFAFTMHQYLNPSPPSAGDGRNSNAISGIGATSLDASPNGLATTWARANGFTIFLGECGWAPDPFRTSSSGNMQYQPAGTNFATGGMTEGTAIMDFMSANSDVWFGWTYFSGGRFISPPTALGYAYYIEPQWKSDSSGFVTPIVDQPQLQILQNHLFLLKRDIDPASNDNDPMWLEKAA